MKELKTLIRLRKRELDALRRQVVQLENKRDQQVKIIENLNDELINELETADELAEMRGFFGDFSEAIKQKQKKVAQLVVQYEQQIQERQIEVSNHYADLKKYEIAYERYLKREAEKLAKQEQEELDEIGIRKYHYGDANA